MPQLILVLLLVPLVMPGCAIVQRAKPPPVIRATQGEQPFVIAGHIVVKYGSQRSSGTVRWTHAADRDEILLFAPLGQTVARIQREKSSVTLDTADQHLVAQDVEELTQQALGWRLPLSGLQYWILALPTPTGSHDIERNESGQIKILRQDGWTVTYLRYATSAADSLPQRLTLHRDGLDIQLRIDEWEIQ